MDSDLIPADLIFTIQNVRLFRFIQGKSHLIKHEDFHLICLKQSKAYAFQIENYQFPIVQSLEVMKNESFNFVFSFVQHIFGLILPAEANPKLVKIFENLLSESATVLSRKGKVQKSLEYLEKGSSKLSQGIAKTANFLVDTMKAGSSLFKKKVKPKDEAVPVSDKNKQKIKKLKKTSNVVVHVSKSIFEGTISITSDIITGVYNQFEPSETMKQIAQTQTFQTAKEIGTGCVSAGSNVYNALEDALVTLGSESAHVGVDMVNHRYGEDMAEATEDTLSIVGNAGMTYRDVKRIGLKNFAKGTAKETVQNIVCEETKE